MTTYTDFVPPQLGPFQWQPTLDGQVYTAIVTWNLMGRRYYLNLYDLSGNLIFCVPVIGSPDGVTIETLSWANGTASAVGAKPHQYFVGATANVTIAGASPDAYNGVVQALVVDPLTITWPIASDPGEATSPGAVFADLSLCAGYFDSTLVFRTSSMQFEVSP